MNRLCDIKAFIEDINNGHEIPESLKTMVDALCKDAPASSSHEEAKAETKTPDVQPMMETVEQMKSQLYQCQKLGFQPEAIICPKESEEIVFLRIKSMDDETVKVTQTCDGHESVAPDIKLTDLLPKYRLHKAKVTELLPGWSPEDDSCSPAKSIVWQNELAKSRVHLAMAITYKEHEHHVVNLELLMNPRAVKVKAPYNKSELQLPAASMKIDRKASKHAIEVGLGMHIAPHFVPPLDKDGKVSTSKWVSPFWMVGSSDGKSPPNMAL